MPEIPRFNTGTEYHGTDKGGRSDRLVHFPTPRQRHIAMQGGSIITRLTASAFGAALILGGVSAFVGCLEVLRMPEFALSDIFPLMTTSALGIAGMIAAGSILIIHAWKRET